MPKPPWSALKRDLAERRRRARVEKSRIAETLREGGILKGLTDAQTQTVTTLIFDASAFANWHDEVRATENDLDVLLARGPKQLMHLRAKVDKLTRDMEELRACMADIARGNVLLATVLDDDFKLSLTVAEIAAAVQKLEIPTESVLEAKRRPRIIVEDPTNPVTHELFKFFTDECGLTKNNATARIAKIENAIWRGNIRDNDPASHTPDRSDAIRKRLKRHTPSTPR